MSLLYGLPFEPGGIPHVLILGSFPSPLSLGAGEYYANPRNQFWDIMEIHLGILKVLPYAEKMACLKERNVCLWDVIFSCERRGAMDRDIRNVTPNNIPLFLHDHPGISLVIANGTTAGKYLKKIRAGISMPDPGPHPALDEPGQCPDIVFGKTGRLGGFAPDIKDRK